MGGGWAAVFLRYHEDNGATMCVNLCAVLLRVILYSIFSLFVDWWWKTTTKAAFSHLLTLFNVIIYMIKSEWVSFKNWLFSIVDLKKYLADLCYWNNAGNCQTIIKHELALKSTVVNLTCPFNYSIIIIIIIIIIMIYNL